MPQTKAATLPPTPHRDLLLSWIDRDRQVLDTFLSEFVAAASYLAEEPGNR